MAFVSAWSPEAGLVVLRDANGGTWERRGGSRAWRNFNPGNIGEGRFATDCGAIGGDSRFAIFPDEATGFAAVVSLFKTVAYQGLTLAQAMLRYAPPAENDTGTYISSVTGRTGIAPATAMRSLSEDDLAALAAIVRTQEGWIPGTECAATEPLLQS